MEIERYKHLNKYLKEKFGERTLKICIDSGFTCPNRDGTVSTGGCIFCSEKGSGEHLSPTLSIKNQIENNQIGKFTTSTRFSHRQSGKIHSITCSSSYFFSIFKFKCFSCSMPSITFISKTCLHDSRTISLLEIINIICPYLW